MVVLHDEDGGNVDRDHSSDAREFVTTAALEVVMLTVTTRLSTRPATDSAITTKYHTSSYD